MLHEYPNLVQGTPEWLQARCGTLTASTIGQLLTPKLQVADNQTSRALTLKLAAEQITGRVEHTYPTRDMERGTEDEPIVREIYNTYNGTPAVEFGFFIREEPNYKVGYSPDGLVGDDGLIEIKSRSQKNQLVTILDNKVPAANMAQIQCGLWVTGRKWCDYLSYRDGMHLYIHRVYPIPEWFNALDQAARTFRHNVSVLIDGYKARTKGMPPTELIPDLDEIVI